MAIENVRIVESISEDNPRFAAMAAEIDAADIVSDWVQARDGSWHVRDTGEPVSFFSKHDEEAYQRGRTVTQVINRVRYEAV